VYPNPSSGKFMVDLSGVEAGTITGMNVTDMLGRRVQDINTQVQGTAAIDISSHAAGVYYLNISTINGLQTIKLVVSK
jgi:hypothetical protein